MSKKKGWLNMAVCFKFSEIVERKRRAYKQIGSFFRAEHTPLEKALMVATGILGGIVLGFALSPIGNGIQIASSNGCGNVLSERPGNKKAPK